jgi:hypothetical protein
VYLGSGAESDKSLYIGGSHWDGWMDGWPAIIKPVT